VFSIPYEITDSRNTDSNTIFNTHTARCLTARALTVAQPEPVVFAYTGNDH